MPLEANQRLGPYLIAGPLGAGGMGEVYRARDTKLNRDVAIKVLPDLSAKDPERFARFTREARTLAALNHPNIAHVHGLEESGGVCAIVMELVEGDDLSAHIARGPMALADALPIARQIADALEAAHEQGIVHRDLKPANVKVRADGTVKVLDFGLAKALAPEGTSATAGDAIDSPTITARGTEKGVILGTAAYMAPEQARGKVVDKRADIWAFGIVLYEMLTGTRAFAGEGFSDVLAAVLRQEVDWTRLPASTPPRLRQILARCLTADPRLRLRDIGEARIAIAAIERGEPDTAADERAAAAPRRWRERLAWSIAALAVIAAATTVLWQKAISLRQTSSPGASDIVRLSVLPPPGLVMNPDSTNVAISPDGRMVAFVVGSGVSTENQLWVRPLDSATARRIEGGDGVSLPFWSPDSGRIGFFAGGRLKTVAAAGGASEVVCNAPFGRGGAWSPSNVIVFAPDANGPLYRVSANGGTPTPVTALDASRKESGHRFPVFLPDGDHFLFAALPGSDNAFDIFAGSLEKAPARTLIGSMENAPVYAPGSGQTGMGWLLFTRQGVLAAQPFDARALRITGEAVSLGDQPAVAPGPAAYDAGRRISASTSGSLAYYLEPVVDTNVQWMDQAGKATGTLSLPAGRYAGIAIAPDNSKAALVRSDSPTTSSIWLVDLTRAGAVPFSTGGGRNTAPVWSPDSARIVFVSDRDGQHDFYERAVADTSGEHVIRRFDDRSATPRGWLPDASILFNRIAPGRKWNIYRIAASGSDAAVPVVDGPAIDVGGWVSPDGRWLAYLSDETGSLDLFVQSFPVAGSRMQASTDAVQFCWWTPDGKHLLFVTRDNKLWRVDANLSGAAPRIGAPVEIATFPPTVVALDLSADGQRFLALVRERAGLGTVTVVQFWRETLAAKR